MEQLKIEYVSIDSIKPYKNNAKQHPKEQIEQIKKSIEQFGMDDPIGIWKDEIVEGHGRLIACKELGFTEVPIIRLDHLTDEERKAYALAHNKLTMNSDFDLDILNDELMSFDTIDMADFGFDLDLEEEDEIEVIEDEPPETPEEPKAKPGDIYQLGNHRLMCGDSTKEEDVDKLANSKEEIIDTVFTDPPYNVDLGYINKQKVKWAMGRYKGANTDSIKNDAMDDEDFIVFLTNAFNNMNKYLKPGRAFYIWHSCTHSLQFQIAMGNVGWKLRQELIWNKSSLSLGMSDYQWKHEPCLYGWKDGASHYFTSDRKQSTVYEDKIDLDKMKKEDMKKLLEEIYSDKVPTTVINENKPLKADLHPTMKPIRLCARLIANSTRPDEIVMDLFGGSGSTMMACEQLGRKCYTMEYDPKYVDVIIERWENFTGQKAVKLN
jgi:DNA modification methylase